MSIDVEDWFQVENLKGVIARDTWDSRELRVERNTDRMLELMAARNIRCTCFILGWVADKCPALIKRIADAGHEIASHGYGHELIYDLKPEQFRADLVRARDLLQSITGQRIRGYRAPSFSITDWAIDILQETGIEYDSSAFPTVAHDRYGKLTGMKPGTPIVQLREGFSRGVRELPERGQARIAVGRRRVFPIDPVRGVQTRRAEDSPQWSAVCVLHPSVGDRCRAAARGGRGAQAQSSLPPLRELEPLRIALGGVAARLRVDAGGRAAGAGTEVNGNRPLTPTHCNAWASIGGPGWIAGCLDHLRRGLVPVGRLVPPLLQIPLHHPADALTDAHIGLEA